MPRLGLGKSLGNKAMLSKLMMTTELSFLAFNTYAIISDGIEEASTEQIALFSLDLGLLLLPFLRKRSSRKARVESSYSKGMQVFSKHPNIHKSSLLSRAIAPIVTKKGISVFDGKTKREHHYKFSESGDQLEVGKKWMKLPLGLTHESLASMGGILVSVWLTALILWSESESGKGELFSDMVNTFDKVLDNDRSMYDVLNRFQSSGAGLLLERYATMVEAQYDRDAYDTVMLIMKRMSYLMRSVPSVIKDKTLAAISDLSRHGNDIAYPLRPSDIYHMSEEASEFTSFIGNQVGIVSDALYNEEHDNPSDTEIRTDDESIVMDIIKANVETIEEADAVNKLIKNESQAISYDNMTLGNIMDQS